MSERIVSELHEALGRVEAELRAIIPSCQVVQADGVVCGRWVTESRPGEAVRIVPDDDPVAPPLWACDRCVPPRRRHTRKALPAPGGGSIVVDVASIPKAPARGRAIGRNEPCPCGSGAKAKRCCAGVRRG